METKPEKKLVFKAEYNEETKSIEFSFGSKHIQTLAHASKVLDYQITELIAQQRVTQEVKEKPIIINAPNNILNRLRGGRG